MPPIDERFSGLEMEVAALTARNELLTSFLMAAIGALSKEEVRETLRGGIKRKIAIANKSMQLDASIDLQNLLRAFNVAMPQG
jgi:TATA-box binding protein (TBP) (component of TFIID and TFIIIB)